MEQPLSPIETLYSPQEDDISLLDILVTLAENIKLLIIGPLLVGLCVLGICYVVPKTFDSVAVLQAEQSTASLMTTAAVLDPVAAGLGLTKDESAEEARRLLREQVMVAVGRNDKLLTLTASAHTPQQAQAIANAVLQQTYLQSRPKTSDRARLEVQLQGAQGRLKDSQDAAAGLLKRIDSTTGAASSGTDLARGYADLLAGAAAAQSQVSALQVQLEGVSDAQLVQAPTLPQKASKPKKALLAIGATLAMGLLLLLFVFMRQAFRDTAQDAEAAAKVTRIRRALGLE
ncbi:MAG: hypothetical protein ABI135_02090 [Rhodoferax sp.]